MAEHTHTVPSSWFGGDAGGADTRWLQASEWLDFARANADDGWDLRDLAGLDTVSLEGFENRFEAVVQLIHRERKETMTVHIMADGEPPTIPSIVDIWPTATFMEREAYDMFGIVFDGHPNLTRILMPDEWEGHPLRKDYGVGKVQVEFVPQPFLQIDAPGQSPSPLEAGTDVDAIGQAVRASHEVERE